MPNQKMIPKKRYNSVVEMIEDTSESGRSASPNVAHASHDAERRRRHSHAERGNEVVAQGNKGNNANFARICSKH